MNVPSIEEIAEQVRVLLEDQHKLDKEDAVSVVALAVDKMKTHKELVTIFGLIPIEVADSLIMNRQITSESATKKGAH